MQKRQLLRQQMKAIRNSMTPEAVGAKSDVIGNRLLELEPVQKAHIIMGFSSINNEIDLWPFMKQLKLEGKTILLPRVNRSNIEAVELFFGQTLQPGTYGILEPEGEVLSPEIIDVIIVPGLVYDPQGYRLGYGAGYYDRFLAQLNPKAFICGVCYEFQICDTTEPQPGDFPVHWIVTERSELLINESYF